VEHKRHRVHNFQRETVHAFLELLGAAGLEHPDELQAWHINRRVSATEVRTYAQIFDTIEPGALLKRPLPEQFERVMLIASSEAF
jgi:hypothetical protein